MAGSRQRERRERSVPLDFFTSGSGSASRMNWPNSFTFPNVIFLQTEETDEDSRDETEARTQDIFTPVPVCVCVKLLIQ